MATTSPDSISYPVSTDQVAPLETVFSTMASSVQTALTNRFKNVAYPVASAAARDAAFPSPVNGNAVYRTDIGFEERYYSSVGSPGWYPVAGIYRQYYYTSWSIGSATASGATLATITYTSLPYASMIVFNIDSINGNGAAQRRGAVSVSASTGTPVGPVSNSTTSNTGTYAAWSGNGYLNVPANTSVTLTFSANFPDGQLSATIGSVNSNVLLIGNY